jgi:hypothetical protein
MVSSSTAIRAVLVMIMLAAAAHLAWLALHFDANHSRSESSHPLDRAVAAGVHRAEKEVPVETVSTDKETVSTDNAAALDVQHAHHGAALTAVSLPDGFNPHGNLTHPKHILTRNKFGNRLYCMVPFYWDDEKTRRYHYEAIMMTWGRRCDVIKFFTDVQSTKGVRLPDNFVRLNTTRPAMCGARPCRHIWEKVWRMLVWTADNEAHLGDWFCKVDEDTYIFPENLKSFVARKGWDPKDNYYFGHMLYNRLSDAKIKFIAGANPYYSHGAITRIAPHLKAMPYENRGEHGVCADRNGANEEVTTSICFRDHLQLLPTTTMNGHGQERIMIFYPKAHLNAMTVREEWGWFWKNKPAHAGVGPNCCAPDPIGFHGYKRWGEMLKIDWQIRSEQGLLDEEPLTRDYILRVRRSIGVDMELFLRSIDAPEHAWDVMRDESIRDYESLEVLTVQDLVNIGVQMGDASKIIAAARKTTREDFYAVATLKNTSRPSIPYPKMADGPVPRATMKPYVPRRKR